MNTLLGGSPFTLSYAQADAAVKQNERTPHPLARYSYPDLIQLWLPELLPPSRIDWLDPPRCGSHHELRRLKRWTRHDKYVMRLQLRQPGPEVLRWVATLNGALMNRLDVALDLIFASEEEVAAADEFIHRHHLKLWHRDQEVTLFKTTRYTASPRAPNKLANYADKECRITGEVYCLHIEWRLIGVQALKRAGLAAVSAVKDIDYYRFWKDRLLLRTVDLQALGRQFRVHVQGRNNRRRGPCSEYASIGNDLMGQVGSVQALVDQYRKQFDVGRCLKPMEIEGLLPVISCSDSGS